jgi:isoleucyl-tRNA synthetase
VYCPVDAAGRIFQAEGVSGPLPAELLGKTVWEINPLVIELLQQHGALAAQAKLDHSYPHCWRCHNALIFRATEQWFIGMDLEHLRGKTLDAIKRVEWYPAWGEERMTNMIAPRPDWCISRQRVWGVPIVAFYCADCSEPFMDKTVLDAVVAQFREHTSDVWYAKSVAELMGPGCQCAKCGGTSFRKETDILDVWFDSGSSHLAVLTGKNGLTWPSDMYVEGGDQFRGWFQSSLLIGVGVKGSSPYRECVTHGWTLDADGRAMSKSLGNIIEPEKIVKKFGADLLRLWVASVDFTEDVRLSDTITDRLSEAYRKLRNTFRYFLGNMDGFDPATHALPGGKLAGFDAWVLLKAEDLVRKCLDWYREYAFHKVYRAVYEFASTELSAIYFDVSKDPLYTAGPTSETRRSRQTALYRLNLALTRLLAPVLSYTCEEVWQHTRHDDSAPPSVHIDLFPNPEDLSAGISAEQREQAADWDRLIPIRGQVLKALDTARDEKLIGAPLEAAVTLSGRGDLYPLFEKLAADLPGFFIVSQVSIEPSNTDTLEVKVARAAGTKCERCWKYTHDVGSDAELPTVCASCAKTVREYYF